MAGSWRICKSGNFKNGGNLDQGILKIVGIWSLKCQDLQIQQIPTIFKNLAIADSPNSCHFQISVNCRFFKFPPFLKFQDLQILQIPPIFIFLVIADSSNSSNS